MSTEVGQAIETFGGPARMARRLGRIMGQPVSASMISNWKMKNDVPPHWRFIIRSHASELGWPSETLPQCFQPMVDW